MKHSISSKIIAVIIAVIMAVGVSAQAYAASTTKYISEMVVASGSSLAAAKKKLTSNGYTPVSDNCSPGFGYTVIGVKTTTNVKEAITDVAVMNMNGKYSFQEYENVLKQYETETEILINELRTAFEEFRANVKAGNPKAIMAKSILNTLTDEDYKDAESDKLGDIICNEDLTDKELSVIMMQSTDYCIQTIETSLSLGVSTDWVTTFVNTPSEQIYTAEDYNAVDRIITAIEPFQNSIKEFEDVYNSCNLSENAGSEESKAAYEALSDYDKNVIDTFSATYSLLKSVNYKNGTLYDFFMKDYDSFEQEELLPLVKAFTPGQLATIPYVGFAAAIRNLFVEDEIIEKTNKNLAITDENGNDLTEEVENLETISIFAGVDRSIFEAGGIALTSDAIANINASNDTSWLKSRMTSAEKTAYSVIFGVSISAAIIGGVLWSYGATKFAAEYGSAYITSFVNNSIYNMYNMSETALEQMLTCFNSGGGSATEIVNYAVEATGRTVSEVSPYLSECAEMATETTANSGYKLMSSIGKVVTGVSLAILFITAIIYLIRWSNQVDEDNEIEYLEIPRIMVEQKMLEDKSTRYVYYYAAKSITDNGHSDYGDLNNFKAQEWIALYYTKDVTAGNPIKASAITVSTPQATDAKYDLGVHMFNNGGVYDLNPFPKDSISEAIHIYIFFETENSANLTATTMNSGFLAISAVAGLAVGAIGMFLIDKTRLKKKAKAAVEAE